MHRHSTTLAATALAILGVAGGSVGTAAADPTVGLPQLGGDVLLLPRAQCAGAVHISLDDVAGDPSAIRVTATPTGTWGTPGCGIHLVFADVLPGEAVGKWMHHGPVEVTLHPGFGINAVSVVADAPFSVGGALPLILRRP